MGVFILGIHMGKGFCELIFWLSVIVLGCEFCSGSVSVCMLKIYPGIRLVCRGNFFPRLQGSSCCTTVSNACKVEICMFFEGILFPLMLAASAELLDLPLLRQD